MKRCLPLFLALLLALMPTLSFAAPPSPTSKDYWVPIASELGDPVEKARYEYDYLATVCADANTNDILIDEFAECCGFIEHDTSGTIYEKDYVLTRNERDFHIVISGNVIWVVFITDQECLCIVEIVTNPKESNTELVSKLMYYMASADPVDARKFDTDLTYEYRLYLDIDIPIVHDRINLTRLDTWYLVDMATVN